MRWMRKPLLNGIRRCSCCGCRLLHQGYRDMERISKLMDKYQICYECAYWREIIDYPPSNYEIVGIRCMKINPWVNERDSTMTLGSRGKVRYFLRPNFTTFKSNDVWIVGTVPERFREQLKPTLQEITLKIFNRINSYPKKCSSKGCFDRYHCLRYKIEDEIGSKPYNNIPYDWKPGGEHCGFFLNKNDIITDESNINRKIRTK